jgi:hypothetical protein
MASVLVMAGNGEELRHRLERTAEEILIQTGHDHAFAAVRQRIAGRWKALIEELAFVDPHDLGVIVHRPQELVRAARGGRRDPHVAVRDDVIVAVAVVDERLEDLDLLPGDLRAAQPPDQLLAFSAEHAAGDDLDPASMAKA